MLNTIKIDKSYAVVGRTAEQALIGSLNFSIINQGSRAIRQHVYGVPVEDNTIDALNDMVADQEAQTENTRVVLEQGFALEMEGPELARLLTTVRAGVAEDLAENCGFVKLESGEIVSNPNTLARSFEESFENLVNLQPKPLADAEVTATAKELGLTEAEVRVSLESTGRVTQNRFLHSKKEDILAWVHNLEGDSDGAEAAEEKLPAMVRARLFAVADNSLVKLKQRYVRQFADKRNPDEAKSIIGQINLSRRLLWEELDMLMETEGFKQQIDEAIERGRYNVNFAARPAPAVSESKVLA